MYVCVYIYIYIIALPDSWSQAAWTVCLWPDRTGWNHLKFNVFVVLLVVMVLIMCLL